MQDNTLTFSNIKMEVNGYEAQAVQIPDGDFSDGLGEFKINKGNEVIADTENKSLQVEIPKDSDAENTTLVRDGLKLESGVSYQLSFMAGAVSGNRDVKVELPDGKTKRFSLTDDWTPTYMSFQVDGVEYYRTENWYSQDDENPQKFAFPAPFDQ